MSTSQKRSHDWLCLIWRTCWSISCYRGVTDHLCFSAWLTFIFWFQLYDKINTKSSPQIRNPPSDAVQRAKEVNTHTLTHTLYIQQLHISINMSTLPVCPVLLHVMRVIMIWMAVSLVAGFPLWAHTCVWINPSSRFWLTKALTRLCCASVCSPALFPLCDVDAGHKHVCPGRHRCKNGEYSNFNVILQRESHFNKLVGISKNPSSEMWRWNLRVCLMKPRPHTAHIL